LLWATAMPPIRRIEPMSHLASVEGARCAGIVAYSSSERVARLPT
jgi:hypothetical protein